MNNKKYIFRYESGEGLTYTEVVLANDDNVSSQFHEWVSGLINGGFTEIPEGEQDDYELGGLMEGS